MKDIAVATDETADKIVEKVDNILKEVYPSLPGNIIDWQHIIGINYKFFKTNTPCRSVIVRFSSFTHKTLFYWNNNKLKIYGPSWT